MTDLHFAIAIDDERLAHEGELIGRIVSGLVERGRRLTAIVSPAANAAAAERPSHPLATIPRIETPFQVLPWVRRLRAERLEAALGRTRPDLLLAVGEETWTVAFDLTRRIEKPFVLDVWTETLVLCLRRNRDVASSIICLAPTTVLLKDLRERVSATAAALVPIGVEVPDDPASILTDEGPLSITVAGPVIDPRHYEPLVAALARLAESGTEFLAALELAGSGAHDAWRLVRRYDIAERVAPIEEAAHFRRLIAASDLMLLPSPPREVRSVLLEAMASGSIVVCPDPGVVDVLDETTSRRTLPTTAGWLASLGGLLSNRDDARALGLAGRTAVERGHAAGRHLDTLDGVLGRIVTGDALPFAPPRS